MKHIAALRCLGAAVLIASALPAHAYFDNYLSSTIVGTLAKQQMATLRGVFNQTLSESEDGATVPFSLPAEGRSKATEGTFTPVTTRTENAKRCRKIRSELRQNGRSERWEGWYCQEADGNWKKTLLKD